MFKWITILGLASVASFCWAHVRLSKLSPLDIFDMDIPTEASLFYWQQDDWVDANVEQPVSFAFRSGGDEETKTKLTNIQMHEA